MRLVTTFLGATPLLPLVVVAGGCLGYSVEPGTLRCDSELSPSCPGDWRCRVGADGRYGTCYPPGDGLLVVEPAYLEAPDWMDYVRRGTRSRPHYDQPGEPCDAVADARIGDCVHAGELRRVQTSLPGCAGLVVRDALDALRWTCDDAGGAAVLHSTGLREEASLGDLLDGAAFRENRVLVEQGEGGPLVAASEPAVWWKNPVRPLPPPGDDKAPVALQGPGTIYTASEDAAVDTYEIADDRVAVVVAEGATLTLRPGNNHCPASSELKHRCLLLLGERRFAWIEGRLRGSTGSAWGVRPLGARYLRLRRLGVSGFWHSGVGGELHTARLEGVTAHRNGQSGLNLSAWQSVLWRVAVADNGDEKDNPGDAGLALQRGSDNVVTALVATSNDNYGLRTGEGARATTVGFSTLAQTGYSGLTFAGDGSSTGFSLLSLGAAGPGIGVRSPGNLLAASAVGHNERAISVYGSSTVALEGELVLAENKIDCTADAGGAVDCATLGDARLRQVASLARVVRGKVERDDAANPSDDRGAATRAKITDWLSFEDRHRAWGKDGSGAFADPSNLGVCVDGCRIWDWRLGPDADRIRVRAAGGDGPSREEVVEGEPCPAAVDGDRAISDQSGNTFLLHARERLGDGLGDDDGLCESGEACVYLPHAGSAQAGTRASGVECVFVDGKVEGARIFGLDE